MMHPKKPVSNPLWLVLSFIILPTYPGYSQPQPHHNLQFTALAHTWDEGLPLGNGTVGALVWQKGNTLRMSLDRADLWDLRPMKGLHRPEFSYAWVTEQVKKRSIKLSSNILMPPTTGSLRPAKYPGGR